MASSSVGVTFSRGGGGLGLNASQSPPTTNSTTTTNAISFPRLAGEVRLCAFHLMASESHSWRVFAEAVGAAPSPAACAPRMEEVSGSGDWYAGEE